MPELRVQRIQKTPARLVISIRCHSCKQMGTFEPLEVEDLMPEGGVLAGQRRCPNPACYAHIFFVHRPGLAPTTFPAERIEFDTSDVPAAVVAALEESISCHAAGCYKAAGMMVRKSLEELCADRGAKGKNLKDRIKKLREKVVIPTDLLDGIDDLRLLGNDAAHVKSRTYDEVGQTEVEVAIEFAKEVLKAVYQYSALLGKLRSLKKPATGKVS